MASAVPLDMSTTSLIGGDDAQARYSIIRLLASGGMARIYLARLHGLRGFERLVVLKTLLHDEADESEIAMLIEEARIGARVNHPNVVRVLDVGRVLGRWSIVMEFLPGHSLAALTIQATRRGQRLDHAMSIGVLLDLLAALDAVHNLRDEHGAPLGLVHRDVSPQNIVITEDGSCKLVDFGIAKHEQAGRPRTKVGILKGKFAYMSPEQIRAGAVDARSDVFSAGVMLWELLVWRRLFFHKDILTSMHAVLEAPIVPPSRICPAVPPELDALVLRALARDPEQRFESAAAMHAALENVVLQRRLHFDARQRQQVLIELFAGEPAPLPVAIESTQVEAHTAIYFDAAEPTAPLPTAAAPGARSHARTSGEELGVAEAAAAGEDSDLSKIMEIVVGEDDELSAPTEVRPLTFMLPPLATAEAPRSPLLLLAALAALLASAVALGYLLT